MLIQDSLQNQAISVQPIPDVPRISSVRSTLPRYLFVTDTAVAGPSLTAKKEADRRTRIQQAAVDLDGQVERLASPFGDGMIYTICQLPSNGAAASFAAILRTAYATGVRTVALPKQPRRLT